MDGWNGERQIGKTLEDIEPKHVERYTYATQHIREKVVLDASCGIGYGSYILSKVGFCVVSVDKSKEAIEYAYDHWKQSNIIYYVFDLESDSYFSLGMFDAIVSFETIEHLKPPIAETIKKFSEILTSGGMLVLSHPEDEKPPGGHFHCHTGIKTKELNNILSQHGYNVITEWMQKGRFYFPYHVVVARKK